MLAATSGDYYGEGGQQSARTAIGTGEHFSHVFRSKEGALINDYIDGLRKHAADKGESLSRLETLQTLQKGFEFNVKMNTDSEFVDAVAMAQAFRKSVADVTVRISAGDGAEIDVAFKACEELRQLSTGVLECYLSRSFCAHVLAKFKCGKDGQVIMEEADPDKQRCLLFVRTCEELGLGVSFHEVLAKGR